MKLKTPEIKRSERLPRGEKNNNNQVSNKGETQMSSDFSVAALEGRKAKPFLHFCLKIIPSLEFHSQPNYQISVKVK